MNNDLNESRHRRPKEKPKYLALRNTLNILFMIGAVAGCVLYWYDSEILGGIIILTAIAFKIAECIIRFMK